MEDVHVLQELAQRLQPREFVAKFPALFLIRRPGPEGGEPRPRRFEYHTASVDSEGLGPLGAEWSLARVEKRPGNPFPDRISVGRANNCDIVLRFPFISKLHAHFWIRDTGLQLADNNSANGTVLNGRPLKAGIPRKVGPGDNISFGPLRLTLVDARRLHAELTGSTQAPR